MDTKKLRQKILDLAIRGKLVPQDPNDEPASVLLERIRVEKERLIKEGKIKRSKKSASDTPHYENRQVGEANEVPFEIPEIWEWCNVSDIFELNPKNDVPDDTQSGFIPMACVDDGFGYAHSFETRPWGEIRKGYSHFQNGDIGIAKISPCFENRKSTIFYDLPNGIGAGTTELTVLRGHCVNIEFYLYLFQSEWYIFKGTKEFKGVVGQQRVNKEIFTTLIIPLPPIEEQNRIVTEIKKWFSLIDTLETTKEDLQESIAQAKSKILDLAIHGKLVPQDPNDEPAIELLKRINPKFTPCDNAHYENLPKGWTVCALEEIIDYEQPQAYIVQSVDYKSHYKTPVLTAGKSFIIGYTNESEGVFTNLPVIIFDDFTTDSKFVDFPFKVKSSAMKILHVKEDVNIQYVCWYMSITKLIGDTHKRYWISEYSKLHIPIPPRKEQDRIINKVNELFLILDNISAEL